MDVIKNMLQSRVDEIDGDDNEKMQKLTLIMYDLLRQFLEDIITDTWMGANSKLALIGGIMINYDGGDMFYPLIFEVRSKNGTVLDLTKETFKVEELVTPGSITKVASKVNRLVAPRSSKSDTSVTSSNSY